MMIKKMQGRFKESSRSFGLLALKVVSGFMIGLTVALIIREITRMGQFGFIFVIICTIGIFFRLSQKWKFSGVLLFNLFCVMTAMLLRMYIVIAPGE